MKPDQRWTPTEIRREIEVLTNDELDDAHRFVIKSMLERYALQLEQQIATDLGEVVIHAREVFTYPGIITWVDAPNKLLDGRTPRACIETGDTTAVYDLLEALADGITT